MVLQTARTLTLLYPHLALSTMINYKEIGLKMGLEVHQQLATHKLFCEDASELRLEPPHQVVERQLRPIAGETGQIDVAAIFEKKKQKTYFYEIYADTTCQVELDEEPPHEINKDALEIALTVAKMLHCTFPETVQVMRKTVVDGSNTSGFQRTALIATGGFLETSFGKVRIATICLEEDSARRTAETPNSVTYRLDRLGIPLIEIATEPDIKTPEQARETAEKLGSLLRATGKVMRGIGTIRQDLNVSVRGHPRVELKGVQELARMPQIAEKEAERQLAEVKSGNKLESHVRNIKEDLASKFLRPMPGAARMYPETDIPLIYLDKNEIEKIKLPEPFDQKEKRFTRLGLSEDLAKQIIRDEKLPLFEHLADKLKNTPANAIASAILSAESQAKQKLGKEIFFSDKEFELVLGLLDAGKIAKEAVLEIFTGIAKGETVFELEKKFVKLTDKELKEEIENLKQQFRGMPPDKLQGIIIGKLRGKAEAKKIIEILK